MKAVFEILTDNINTGNCSLICEASNDGFSYLVKNDEENKVVALAVYHFNTGIHGNYHSLFQKIAEDQVLLSENFKKVIIIYSYPASVLIPFSLYDSQNNSEALNMIHGDFAENYRILTDVLIDDKIYNCYRVPSEVLDEISNKFPAWESFHQYSVLMKNSIDRGDKLSVIFYPQKIVVMLEANGKLLLINSYHYKTAEDVSYALLNACRQFEIENIPVEVSGLVEKDSALYKEMYKYFNPVNFASLPVGISLSEEINTYPPHFFSHLFAL